EAELRTMVDVAGSSGRPVVAHASSAEGMRRAIVAGVETVEHGDGGTAEVFKLMKDKGVCFVPTLAAGDATSQYRGWKHGQPERAGQRRKSVLAIVERHADAEREDDRRQQRERDHAAAAHRNTECAPEIWLVLAQGDQGAEFEQERERVQQDVGDQELAERNE